jgi:AcrR family transcriptional regulator
MPTPDRTSLAEIVEAGRALIEEGGAARLTMQAVAERVGVKPPSLYKRVRDRDALLALVAEATVDDLTQRLGASDGALAGLAHAYRAFAHAHPEGFRLMFTVDGAAGSLDRASEPILRVARDLVGEDVALEAARLITAWATGFIDMELAGAFRLGGDVDRAFEFGLERLERGLREA